MFTFGERDIHALCHLRQPNIINLQEGRRFSDTSSWEMISEEKHAHWMCCFLIPTVEGGRGGQEGERIQTEDFSQSSLDETLKPRTITTWKQMLRCNICQFLR